MIILDRLYLVMLFLTIVIGLLRFKSHSYVFKLLIILIILSFITEMAGKVVAVKRHNNLPLYHCYALIEYLFLTAIYVKILHGLSRKIITGAVIPMVLFAFFNSFYLQGINRFPSNFLLICELIYMLYSLLGFRQMLLHPIQTALHKQSLFWLNLALIIFSTTLFINFGLTNYLTSRQFNEVPLVIFVNIINLIYVALLAIAILKDVNAAELSKLDGKYQ